ncbi:MAG: lipoprotein, partial [Caldilineaceae bacterium]|nr:lipoprotein [Caldilineaceae bacterium]
MSPRSEYVNLFRPLRRIVVLAVAMLVLAACAPVRPM